MLATKIYVSALSIASRLIREQKDICNEDEYDFLYEHMEEISNIFFKRKENFLVFPSVQESKLNQILSESSKTEYELLRALEFYVEMYVAKKNFETDLLNQLKKNEENLEHIQERFLPRFMKLSIFAYPELLLQMGIHNDIERIIQQVDKTVPANFISRYFSYDKDDEQEWDGTCPCCNDTDISCIEEPVRDPTGFMDGDYRFACNACGAVFVVGFDENGFLYEPSGFLREENDVCSSHTINALHLK